MTELPSEYPTIRRRTNVRRTSKGEIAWSEYTIDATGLTQEEHITEMTEFEARLEERMAEDNHDES